METAILRSLTVRRRKVAERQRMAGVALADWLQFNAKGGYNLETSAKMQRYIALEVERIERCTAELLELDAKIKEKTASMSDAMKELIEAGGIIF